MKSVLITGGTGTLGHGIVEKLLQTDECKRICILARSERGMAVFRQRFPSERIRPILGSVHDYDAIRRAVERCEVVIHAAALKRIDLCQYNPVECYKTNLWGSENVLRAAEFAGAQKVILVSTDKAFEPLNDSPYGLAKASAERLFLHWNECRSPTSPAYSIVRYGNVWCSAGSVVPLWRSILSSGGRPVITDPECTRFFMLLSEAVDFVLGAVEKMRGGEIFVPDLPAYRLGDLASAMWHIQSEKELFPRDEWEIVGLPKHEKLHESMEKGKCSKDARRMSAEELRSYLP